MVKIGTVSQLTCYPVKSCGGIPVKEGVCTTVGFQVGNVTDRHWMVARSNGDFVTQRQAPKMALIRCEVGNSTLAFNAPGMPTLQVPLNPKTNRGAVMKCRVWKARIEGLDCGDDAACWFTKYLSIPGLRLLFSSDGLKKQDLTKTKDYPLNLSMNGDQAAFSDWCAYLIASEASLEALNDKLLEKVTMKNFRPNIVIKGCSAFDEDNWKELQIGESATFRMLDPCQRCRLTTVNQDTGELDPTSEPLETLKKMRCFPAYTGGPLFGVNAALDFQGHVQVGDPVYAIKK